MYVFSHMQKLERKRKRKTGKDLMKIKGRSVEERDQGVRGEEKGEKFWGLVLAKLYCYIVCMYEHVTTNLIKMYNYNASIKM